MCKESEKDKINEIKESDKSDESDINDINNDINNEANERARDIEIKMNEKAEKIKNEAKGNKINLNGLDNKGKDDEIKEIAKLMVKNKIVITKATRDGLIEIGKWCVLANEYRDE